MKPSDPSQLNVQRNAGRIRRSAIYLLLYLAFSFFYFGEAILQGRLITSSDGIDAIYPLRKIGVMLTGSPLKLWNPYIYSGFPYLATMQPSVLYPFNWLYALLPLPFAYNLGIVLHFAMAAFFTFLYARLLGAGDFPAFASGLIFGFLGFTAFYVHHAPILQSSVWLPLILFFLEKLRQSLDMRYALLASLSVGLHLLGGYPLGVQSIVPIGMFAIFYTFTIPSDRRLKFAGLILLALSIALLLALPQIAATAELASLTTREGLTYKQFTSFSLPFHMLPALLLPRIWGKGHGGPYWGPFTDLTDMEGFIGFFTVVLAIVTFIAGFRRNAHVRFLGAVAAAGLLLSFGGYLPFFKLFWHIPVFNLFRGHSKHLFEFDLAASVLFAIGLTELLKGNGNNFYRRVSLLILAAIAAAVVALLTLFKGPLYKYVLTTFNLVRPYRISEALSLSNPSIYIPLAFISAYGAWLFLLRSKRIPIRYLLILIIFAEALLYRGGGWPKISEVKGACDSGVFGFLGQHNDGRVSFMHEKLIPMRGAMCGLRMIDGYEAFIIKRYNSLLELDTRGIYEAWDATAGNNVVLSMLGAKHIVVSHAMTGVFDSYPGYYEKIYSDKEAAVYVNKKALPAAFTVRHLMGAPERSIGRDYFLNNPFDPSETAVVSEADLERIGRDVFATGNVRIMNSESESVVLRTGSSGDMFLVLSEQYYPGWKAYIDGKETTIYRADAVLRGVSVPPGEHSIRFVYRPFKVYAAFGISILTLAGATYLLMKARKRKNVDYAG